jgi:CRP-like cAMP-binding protein
MAVFLNCLLLEIERRGHSNVLRRLTRVSWAAGDYLYHQGGRVDGFIFLEQGVVSVSRSEADGSACETATYGGQVGVMIAGSTLFTRPHRAVGDYKARTDGCGWRITREALNAEMAASPALRELFEAAVGVMMEALNQLVVCRTKHAAPQRLARVLLILRAAVRQDQITLPRSVLAEMVPCAEKAIYKAARPLIDAGAIRLSRGDRTRNGIIDILDAAVLDHHACDCYEMLVAARRAMVAEK